MNKFYGVAIALGVVWITVVVSSGAGFNPFPFEWDFSNPGAFGDSFGPVNSLMAALAAISAIAAYRSQQREIQRLRARESDEDRRAEASDFERTFFQLLEHHRSISASIDIDGNETKRVGQDAFKAMAFFFERRTNLGYSRAWADTFKKYQNDLGHYYRFLYHFISFVDSKSDMDCYRYVRFIRATLSESETFLLAMNCCWGEGRDKFKPLVEKYALLHNLSNKAVELYDLKDNFSDTAFGNIKP